MFLSYKARCLDGRSFQVLVGLLINYLMDELIIRQSRQIIRYAVSAGTGAPAYRVGERDADSHSCPKYPRSSGGRPNYFGARCNLTNKPTD